MTSHRNSLVINVCIHRAQHQNSSNVTIKHIMCVSSSFMHTQGVILRPDTALGFASCCIGPFDHTPCVHKSRNALLTHIIYCIKRIIRLWICKCLVKPGKKLWKYLSVYVAYGLCICATCSSYIRVRQHSSVTRVQRSLMLRSQGHTRFWGNLGGHILWPESRLVNMVTAT